MAQVKQSSIPVDSMSSTTSAAISTLMAMAEYMLCQRPQRITESIQCLLALLTYSPPPRVEARVRLQLGLTLYHHTNNLLEARQSLEQAMLSSGNISGMEEVKFEAASVLARIHMEQGFSSNARKVLRSVMDISNGYPYWHCRLLLQKASIYVKERDFDSLIIVLTQAADYAHQIKAPCTRSLCLLAKGVHLLVNQQYQDGASALSEACSLIEANGGPKQTLHRAFYMIVQVTHLLNAGLIKTAKPHMKQLQQCVKHLSSEPMDTASHDVLNGESFVWLSREQTYVLAYLVCIMHSVLAGNIDKALNYTGKAINLIQVHKDSHPVMITFQAHLLENITVCLLMQGKVTLAGSTLQEVISVCYGHNSLVYSHRAVLHTLLGLYSFSTDCLDNSITQFLTALQHTNNSELKIFININLAICYMKLDTNKDKEIQAIINSFDSESQILMNNSKCLKGAISFVRGLYAYRQVKLHEAKRQLRETLALSNNNDLNKLTVCSLLLLGKIFLSLGNNKETQDMVGPASHLSSKIQDKRLQLWAAALSGELHHSMGDAVEERKCNEKLIILKRELQEELKVASSGPYHNLTMWTVGDWPIVKPFPVPVSENTCPDNEEVWPQTSDIGRDEIKKTDKVVLNVTEEHLPEEEIVNTEEDNNHTDNVVMKGSNDIVIGGQDHPMDVSTSISHGDHKRGKLKRGKRHIDNDGEDLDQGETLLPEKKIKLSSDPSHQDDDNGGSSVVEGSNVHVHASPSRTIVTDIQQQSLPNNPQNMPLLPDTRHTPFTDHSTIRSAPNTSPITSNNTGPVQTSPFMSETTMLHPPSGNLPTYNESLICNKSPVQQSHTHLPHPVIQQQQPPTTSSSHLEFYRQQQRNLRHQLEALKQQQVLFHQAGSATPQQWHELQVQHQQLMQKKNMIDGQIQQLLMREEQMKIHQQNQQLQQEMERREIKRRQAIEHDRIRIENEQGQYNQSALTQQQHHHERSHQSSTSSLWKPITNTPPQLLQSSPPTGLKAGSFLPTPPLSSQEMQRTPPQPTNVHTPQPATPPNHHNLSLSTLMKSPSALSIGSSPDLQSGFNTPSSTDHTHPEKNTPVHQQIEASHQTLSRNPTELSRPQMAPPPLQPHPTPHQHHHLMHNQGEHHVKETEAALLRQQEHQRRLMIQQQQQMFQQQLRQAHDPNAFLLQHGMVPLAYHQQHHQIPPGLVHQQPHPMDKHRSNVVMGHTLGVPQQPGVPGTVPHPALRQPQSHTHGTIGGYPHDQFLPYGKRDSM